VYDAHKHEEPRTDSINFPESEYDRSRANSMTGDSLYGVRHVIAWSELGVQK
jgi:hypothetical protein